MFSDMSDYDDDGMMFANIANPVPKKEKKPGFEAPKVLLKSVLHSLQT
jgi:hypothetical protein